MKKRDRLGASLPKQLNRAKDFPDLEVEDPRGGGYLTREVTGVCGKPLNTLSHKKIAQKYTLSHKNFAKIHCFMITLKGVLPHDTLSHNFLINCNTLSHNLYQKRTPCRIIFTAKGHPVERHIPSSQVWEYPRVSILAKLISSGNL